MIIKWDTSYHVNIDEIDQQHKKLVGIVNRLAEAMADGEGKKVLAKIIDELIHYTRTHFQTEEHILQHIHYPGFKGHQHEHAEFVKKVTDFQANFDRGQLGLTIEVMNFLCDWIRNHIKKSDKQYATYIEENELQI